MATVALIGSLDTKGREYAFVRGLIESTGETVLLIDTGIRGVPAVSPDIPREEVAREGGMDISAVQSLEDRTSALQVMASGAQTILTRLNSEGRIHGLLGLGGSNGTALISHAARALPLGFPTLIVSTVASGDIRPYVGSRDITMMYSVADISGLNRITESILVNAAAAIAGMARLHETLRPKPAPKLLIAATMFGVTTPSVTAACARLEELGYETIIFHATGVGGASMEEMIATGAIAGVLDVTTTELGDELVGGSMSAGPTRLEAAGMKGIPQVVSLGALNVVNFGPLESIPTRFRKRHLLSVTPAVTVMRTSVRECRELGRIMALKLNKSCGPVQVFIPLQGISSSAIPGSVFYDPNADRALIRALELNLKERIRVYKLDMDINDIRFAHAMANALDADIRTFGAHEPIPNVDIQT